MATNNGLSSLPYFENSQAETQKKQLMFFPLRGKTIDKRENQYLVQVYADMVKIKKTDAPPPKHCIFKRGIVTGFSAKSRKRMIEVLASVCDTPDLFCTLTFADDTYAREDFDPKYYFELFRHWLEYRYPNITAIWRMEAEDRKSGEFIGDRIPHFHLLIWLPKHQEIDRDSLLKDEGLLWRKYWHSITDTSNEYHLLRYGLQLQQIKSRRHAYHYVSKYAAKLSDDELEIGRRWGTVGQVDDMPVFEIEMSTRQFIELRRLIISYVRKRTKFIAKKLSRQTIKVGLTAFALGAWNEINHGLDKSTIWKMIGHAIELAALTSSRRRVEQPPAARWEFAQDEKMR